jgi:hypothetical protein
MSNSVNLIIERSDAKRQIIPLQGNSTLQSNAAGDPYNRLDPRAVALEVDFTEAWAVTDVAAGAGGAFKVAGDVSARFPHKSRLTIDGSTNNDKVWTVEGAVYDSTAGKTTISVISTETVGAVADGSIFPYDLVLRPGVGVSVALDGIQGVLKSVDTMTTSPIFTLERRSQTEQVLTNAVSLGNAITLATQDIRAKSTSLSNNTFDNTYPMYLRRIRAASATTCSGKILLDGQSL